MYTDNALCPARHRFKIRRRDASAGSQVDTYCPVCKTRYLLIAGPLPLRALESGKKRAPNRESQIEQRLVKRVKELGGEVRKVKWIGRKGAPDRLVMLPLDRAVARLADAVGCPDRLAKSLLVELLGRVAIWPELKAPGKAATFPSNPHERAQRREHERMRKMGQRVEVIDSYEQIEELLK